MERAPKVCSEPGCINDAAVKSGRCVDHQEKPWVRQKGKRRAPVRGYSKLRKVVLRRDGGLCVFCWHTATDVDHRIPVAWGGRDELENLQSMCDRCHGVKSREEQRLGAAIAAGTAAPGEVRGHVARWTPDV